MVRRYVTDLIGDEYKKWESRERILLSYPTGMGKTYFILHVLLRHAAELGEHLVYYCNRKFLNLQMVAAVKQQNIAQMGEEGKKLADYLHVRSYQNAECTGSYPTVYRPKEKRDLYGDIEIEDWRVKYFIFDEAQYPVADSLLNPHTAFWVQCKRAYRESLAIHIYLTATPEPYQLFLSCLKDNLEKEDLRNFLARYRVKQIIEKGGNADYWMQFCSRQLVDLMERHRQIRQSMDQYGSAWMMYRDPNMYAMWCRCKSELDLTDAMIASERDAIYQECKDPFQILYDFVESAYGVYPRRHYRLDASPEEIYGYVDERYFDDLTQMAPRIADSVKRGERWLVFVRKKKQGEALQIALKSHGCSSITIDTHSAGNYDGRRVPRRSARNRAMDQLVWNQELGCNVLISTSVLDNGISLHADAVDHLVLCQPGKTSFLQMLGRVRVREGQRLRVYIQRMTPKEIKGYIDRCRKDILFLVRWDLNGYWGPAYRMDESQQLTRELQDHPHRVKYLVKAKSKSERDEINKLALFCLLGSLYDMEVRAKQHGDGTAEPNYYLRYQLSWLGKTYDPTRWVDYRQTQDGLMEYLGRLEAAGQKIDKAGQVAFRRECLKLLLDLRQTMPYFDSVKVRFSMERQKYPGLKVLNTAFGDAGVPFVIVNRQQGKSRETYWYIEKRNETKEAEHPLQDAPKLTDSQDTSDGSCSPSEDIPVG